MNKKKISVGMSVGFISLLVIFVVLCLVTFAILALSSSQADMALTRKSADYQAEYYAANNECQRKLAWVDGVISEGRNTAADDAQLFAYIEDGLKGVVDYDVQTGEAWFGSEVGERGTSLLVRIRINGLTEADNYDIISWHVEVSPGALPEQTIDLWDGE